MKSRIVDAWIRIHASYWFIPSLMAIVAIVSSVLVVDLDTRIGSAWLQEYEWLYANQPAGARALLSTVAGSMITVAGVTFSMTLLGVSHASAQIGPRLLSAFMRDRGNQFTLGTFIATFLYCLMVLRTVHAGVDGQQEPSNAVFVPHMAILVAIALAVLSVVVLIFFIHHVSQSINVAYVVARVGDELIRGIQSMFPERVGERAPADSGAADIPEDFEQNAVDLAVPGSAGYLRVLDGDGLLELTSRNDLIVELYHRPGDFGVPGQSLMRVWPAGSVNDELAEALCSVFSWGTERTQEQDVMFPAEQLVEILAKAMSPGINGQYTALLCIDQFERAFAELLQRNEPEAMRVDEQDALRVIARPVGHEEFFSGVLRPIRQFVRDDWLTTHRLLEMLERLRSMPELAEFAPLLSDEMASIKQEVEGGTMVESEKELIAGIGDEASGGAS